MKEIKLTQGKVALVDDEDFDYLNQFKWYAREYDHTFYACRAVPIGNSKQKVVRMHRVILGLTEAKTLVDHKDHNGLNNQRNNLRTATPLDNAANRKGFGSSKYLGVTLSARNAKKPWVSRVHKGSTSFHLGYFKNEVDAALAYNKKAQELFGEFANLNKISLWGAAV